MTFPYSVNGLHFYPPVQPRLRNIELLGFHAVDVSVVDETDQKVTSLILLGGGISAMVSITTTNGRRKYGQVRYRLEIRGQLS
jgi:hypothetical protein